MAKTYSRLINEYKFEYPIVCSAKFNKQDEDDQVLDEVDFQIASNISQKLT